MRLYILSLDVNVNNALIFFFFFLILRRKLKFWDVGNWEKHILYNIEIHKLWYKMVKRGIKWESIVGSEGYFGEKHKKGCHWEMVRWWWCDDEKCINEIGWWKLLVLTLTFKPKSKYLTKIKEHCKNKSKKTILFVSKSQIPNPKSQISHPLSISTSISISTLHLSSSNLKHSPIVYPLFYHLIMNFFSSLVHSKP